MKIRAPVIIWAIAVAVFLVSVFASGTLLPERVATHFGANGHANGWMSRSGYLVFVTILGIFVSSFVIGISYSVRFFPSSTLNVPKSEYWRSPEHYREACDFLFFHSFWFGSLYLIFVTGSHYLTVQENRTVPAVADLAQGDRWTTAFLTGIAVWFAVMIWHFAHPPISDTQK